jgi:exopolysaccharide biosynthesis polyprenyl glycosylphosphotransferase
MVKQHNQLMQACLGVCDLVVVVGAWTAAFWTRFTFFPARNGDMPTQQTLVVNMLLAAGVVLAVSLGMGLYRPRRDKSFLLELGQILKTSLLAWVVLLAVIAVTNDSRFTRGMLFLFLPLLMAGLVVERGAFRVFLRYIRRRGWNLRHALIVGTGRLGQSTLQKLTENSWTGIRVSGFIELAPTGRQNVCGVPILGTTAGIAAISELHNIDCVFVALPSKHGELLTGLIRDLEQTPVDVRIVPDLFLSRFPMRIAVGEIDGLPILSLREDPLAGWPTLYKRAFDIAGALFALGLFGLPMLLIAALIRVSSSGPAIYCQRRVSVGGRPFNMLKFRTMRCDAEAQGGPVFATPNDPRCTGIGSWLRSYSLDELPQLFNVLKGDMSLVGPRPERPEMLEKIRREVPGFPIRLKMRAGLTGWAQVHGFRGRTSFRKRLQYDLYYLNHWSPMLDVRIVFTTLLRGFRHPNAY